MYDCSSSMYRLRTAVMSKQLVIYNILNEINYSNYFQDIGSGTEEQIDQNGGQTNAPKANLNTHQQEPDHQQQRPALASADVVGLAVVSQSPTCTLVIMMRHTLIAVTMIQLSMTER